MAKAKDKSILKASKVSNPAPEMVMKGEDVRVEVLKQKHPGGRPSKFKELDMEKVKFLALKGFTEQEIADFYKINESTMSEWKKKYPEFAVSLKEWKNEADHKVERSLYERAIGYSHKAVKILVCDKEVVEREYIEHYAPDPVSCIFWLKNRKRAEWRDKHEVEHSGAIDITAKNLLDKLQEAETKSQNRLIEAHAN